MPAIEAATTGGCETFRSIDLDETPEEVKGSPGQIYGAVALNGTTSPLYAKFYNAPVAEVTVGTTTPKFTVPIPTNGDENYSGWALPIPAVGATFTKGITVAVTTGLADGDTGAPAANAVQMTIWYK